MISGALKAQVSKIWDSFWTGGVANPITVLEQITYLLFIKRLDEIHTTKELKANRFKKPIEKPVFKDSVNEQQLRWSKFKDLDPETMYEVVSTKVFPFIKTMNGSGGTYSDYMKDATFMIPTPKLLDQVVTLLNDIPMEDRDTKGDLYEYLLSKLTTSGKNGQFRTPRHIIDMMVALVEPKLDDTVCDPACGTAGFLIGTLEYMRKTYPDALHDEKTRDHFLNNMFNGNDFDRTMRRIAVMNLVLHGIENPNITDRDALSENGIDAEEKYSLILANPPFKGSLDYDAVSPELLKVVKTKKTELLFLALFIRLLKLGGRCAVIVPDGVLFGSSKAHKEIREQLVDKQKLEAVISMPSGVFKPYAGVSTAILIFTKTNSGGTDNVWFYDMKADGYSLDDKRDELDSSNHDENNIPDILNRYKDLASEEDRKRTDQSFLVPVKEIQDNKYDLSINRYREIEYEKVSYEAPEDIIKDIRGLESGILTDLEELERMWRQIK